MQRAILTLALALGLAFSLRAGDEALRLTPEAQALSATAAAADLSPTAQALSPTAAAQDLSATVSALDLSPTAAGASLSPTAQALSPTAALPELPASLSGTAAPELPASLPETTPAPTPAPEEVTEFVAQPKSAPGMPWADTILAGFGGGLVGSAVAFFSSQNGDNVAGFQSQFQKTLPLYGGGGLVVGALTGFFFGSGEPDTPVPPELKRKAGLGFKGLDVAATPQGGAMDLRLDF